MKEYKCGICNKSYDRIEDRMACESKCYDDRKKAEEAKKKAELEEAKNARKEELDLACKKYLELRSAYMRDYGHYTYSRYYGGDNESSAWEDFWRNW